jgi:NAD(P)H-dependent FMN reductase
MKDDTMSQLNIAVIIGSTRDQRFAAIPAQWIYEKALLRGNINVEMIDLKDFQLPLFNEIASNARMPSRDPKALAWQAKIGEFDAYIIVTPEYNHSIPGALKNALDQAYVEWVRKPVAFVGYGGLGAARAVEHLRGIVCELQMAPVRAAVHIGGGEFRAVHPHMGKQPFTAISSVVEPSGDEMLNDLIWWADALKAARLRELPASKSA